MRDITDRHGVIGMGNAQSHDANEFSRLYRESYPMVYGYVRRRMDCDAAAEDVVAEAYLLAARSFYRFDPSLAKFSTWVTHIAINCMASHFRKEHAAQPLEDIPDRLVSVGDETGLIAERELVERMLAVLGDSERALVRMKYYDGKRNVDIATELGMNPSTVSTMLSRALAKMRDAYERSM